MNIDKLTAEFGRMRAAQATLYNKPMTAFDEAVGNAVLRSATLAMGDVEANGRRGIAFRVCTAQTGTGKTMSSVALIAAGFKSGQRFSAAYVVGTCRQAEEVRGYIADLIGAENVTCWTDAHDKYRDPEQVREKYGFAPEFTARRRDLASSRVVVVTHALWLSEAKGQTDMGVQKYGRRQRSVIFVDEAPDLVTVIEQTPGDVMKLRDQMIATHVGQGFLPTLNGIIERMNLAFQSTGANYAEVELVGWWDRQTLEQMKECLRMVATPKVPLDRLQTTLRFLIAASQGCVFLCRKPATLVAYEAEGQPGPGHVLLDATADLSGLTVLMPGMVGVEVPKVDYSALQTFHIALSRFSRVADVVKSAKEARAYAEVIKATVLANTSPGEEVLVVAHKAMFGLEFLPQAEDPAHPFDWEGRRVGTLSWGAGIGSNRFKDKVAVFMFGEFYIPRRAVISTVHGLTDEWPTEASLTAANTQNLQGEYLTALDGHLLRWHKQLASRGNVRNIDGMGKAGAMRLYSTMDLGRMLQSWPSLFPGAPAPVLRGAPEGTAGKLKAPAALIRLLGTTTDQVLWSDKVEELTGVRARRLKVALAIPKVKAAADIYGWRFTTAKDLGQPGKRTALARGAALGA